MNIKISENEKYRSNEIYFDACPSLAVRDAVKNQLKCKYHGEKKCWYSAAEPDKMRDVILAAMTPAEQLNTIIYMPGYMGNTATYGGRYATWGYSWQDCKRLIAADIKSAGIRGVTLSVKHGTITAKIRFDTDRYISFNDYCATYRPEDYYISTISYTDDNGADAYMWINDYYDLPAAEQQKIRLSAAKAKYNDITQRPQIANSNSRYVKRYLTSEALTTVERVERIMDAYNYSAGNMMVDYYDSGFFAQLLICPTGKTPAATAATTAAPAAADTIATADAAAATATTTAATATATAQADATTAAPAAADTIDAAAATADAATATAQADGTNSHAGGNSHHSHAGSPRAALRMRMAHRRHNRRKKNRQICSINSSVNNCDSSSTAIRRYGGRRYVQF